MAQQVQQDPLVVQEHLVQQEVQDHLVHLVQMEILVVSRLNINGLRVQYYPIQAQEN